MSRDGCPGLGEGCADDGAEAMGLVFEIERLGDVKLGERIGESRTARVRTRAGRRDGDHEAEQDSHHCLGI